MAHLKDNSWLKQICVVATTVAVCIVICVPTPSLSRECYNCKGEQCRNGEGQIEMCVNKAAICAAWTWKKDNPKYKAKAGDVYKKHCAMLLVAIEGCRDDGHYERCLCNADLCNVNKKKVTTTTAKPTTKSSFKARSFALDEVAIGTTTVAHNKISSTIMEVTTEINYVETSHSTTETISSTLVQDTTDDDNNTSIEETTLPQAVDIEDKNYFDVEDGSLTTDESTLPTEDHRNITQTDDTTFMSIDEINTSTTLKEVPPYRTPTQVTTQTTINTVTTTTKPIQVITSTTPSDATISSKPIEVTTTVTPIEVTTSTLPIDLTAFTTSIEVITSKKPVEITAMKPIEITTSMKPIEITTSKTPIEITTSKTPIEVTTSAMPIEVTTSATTTEVTTFATTIEVTTSATPIEVTTSASTTEVTTSVTPIEIATSATPTEVTIYRTTEDNMITTTTTIDDLELTSPVATPPTQAMIIENISSTTTEHLVTTPVEDRTTNQIKNISSSVHQTTSSKYEQSRKPKTTKYVARTTTEAPSLGSSTIQITKTTPTKAITEHSIISHSRKPESILSLPLAIKFTSPQPKCDCGFKRNNEPDSVSYNITVWKMCHPFCHLYCALCCACVQKRYLIKSIIKI